VARAVDSERALGALLGLAVGDALGAPLENLSRDEIAARHGGPVTEMVGGGRLGLAPGEVTNDTRLALRLADSLISLGGFDGDAVLRAYLAWFHDDPGDVSPAMREVLSTVAGGTDAYRATSMHGAGAAVFGGNGPLVRTTPLGIAFAQRPSSLRDASLAEAALTHFDPLSGKAAFLHNQVIAWQLTGGPHLAYSELKDPSWLDDRLEDAVIPAVNASLAYAENVAAAEPGSAVSTLAVGLAAYFNAGSFEEGLAWAVNLGGDADSNGAVTGALLGARFGPGAIPARWLEPIAERPYIERTHRGLMALAAS
jgi:ADP-ribosyl-[dinitrogen reductase] hydrolase